jgi:16S rRNA (guanine(966)-N(2))-methyltransferase RsmD
MRIVAGEWRGRTLKAPTWEGLRPTSDRLRETLFNILAPSIQGAQVMDAYAGTGAIGIEALSRGAAFVTFVESDRRAAQLIERNLAPLGGEGRYAIIRAEFADAVRRWHGAPLDILIADPPYGTDAVDAVRAAAAALGGDGTRVVVEHARRYAAPPDHDRFALRRTVTAGDSALSFYERH